MQGTVHNGRQLRRGGRGVGVHYSKRKVDYLELIVLAKYHSILFWPLTRFSFAMCFRYPIRYQPKVTANLVFSFDIKPKPKLFSVVSISIIQAVLSWDKISDRHTASSNQAQIVSEDPFSIAPLRNATTLSFAGGAAASW